MNNTKASLELYEAIIGLIERKREETGDPTLGAAVERVVIDQQFRDLERDIFEDPGAFERWLIRRRPDNA